MSLLRPLTFAGGLPREYAIEVLSNGGLGTRHLTTGRVVPHALAAGDPELVNQTGPIVGARGALTQYAGTATQTLQVGLSIANLGVGLLNLGVNTWSAWKIHKLDRKVDALTTSVARVEGKVDTVTDLVASGLAHLDALIRTNSLLLGLLIEHQGRLSDGIAQLRQELAQGFRSLHDALSSAEARREALELERQMRTLFRYYEVCTYEMRAGRRPPTADLRSIIDTATRLIAWLDTRLAPLPVGSPERLPLLIARATALKLEVDARDLLEEAPGSRDTEFRHLRDGIREELNGIIEGTPVFVLAQDRRALVEQYVYLDRALRGCATMVEFGDGRVLPFYPENLLTWDDGLQRVRDVAARPSRASAPPRLGLETLEDHNAWQRLAGLPRGGSDDEINRADLGRALGLPDDNALSEEGLLELLRISGGASDALRSRIRNEVKG